jgi:hypothetical protein
VVQFEMKGKIIRRKVIVHEIVIIVSVFAFPAELKRDARAIMCPHLMTGEAHQHVILCYQFQ